MSFFVRNKGTKRKSNGVSSKSGTTTSNKGRKNGVTHKKKRVEDLDEEIMSDEFEDDDEIEPDNLQDEKVSRKKRDKDVQQQQDDDYESEMEEETAQEKKIRLAKQYLTLLENIESERKTRDDDEEEEESDEESRVHRSNLITSRLRDGVLEKAGQLYRPVADGTTLGSLDDVRLLKNGHRKPITALVVSYDTQWVFTASQECNIIKWNRASGKRIATIFGDRKHPHPDRMQGHAATITSLAISTDGKFLASGDMNKLIHIWNPTTLAYVHTFRGHRGAITALAFRRSFHQLFSVSDDRLVKVWNLDEMAYVESLFGHHDAITAVDSFVRERAITAGGRDGTIRLWKLPEESHLIFLTGADATIDCVKFIDESHFVSACDDGSVSVWGIFKKKPLVKMANVHGEGKWITAIAALRNTDLFATGSHNGKIYFWKIGKEFRSVTKVFEYDVVGFVNALEFTVDGRYLIAAIGQEHRLGRWWRIPEARNMVHIIPLNCTIPPITNTESVLDG